MPHICYFPLGGGLCWWTVRT